MDDKTLHCPAYECDPGRSLELAGLSPGDRWRGLSPDAVVCLDEKRRMPFFNRAADEMFQTGDTLVIGQPPWQCAPLLAILEELRLDATGEGNGVSTAPQH